MNNWVHLCIDMQRMFSEDTPWHVTWMKRVVDEVLEVSRYHRERTIFTRFVPPRHPSDMPGMWQTYYEKWHEMTLPVLAPGMVDLIPELRSLVPPARVFDKSTYSPWTSGHLHPLLDQEEVTALVITGGETDMCVLATVLGAIDLGYKVILLRDAVCSGADDTHDASLELLASRFSVQVEVLTTEEFLRRSSPI
ncbi:cysteine hydrolase family protein [Agrobacterium sp. Azo12]|uniref:cysteine hydrolase family protein n=1 Tax=Agrobacterium sp. Azo12 TaxID=3031129 RepID=UPI0023D891D3|nr:isochorismatase family cysteine hydrolase [Agrobacterium sp. Azo12]MDO5897196.1 isochorismatase family cysteine hydrolase [Agrobacterium sp. Azo12]